MKINIPGNLDYRFLRTLGFVSVLLAFYSCTTSPSPKNELISDGNLQISLIESRSGEPAKNVMVEIEKFDENEIRDDIRSDEKGILLIPNVYSKSFPITISFYDSRYLEKKETIDLNNITNQIEIQLKETIISGGIMDNRNQAIEECIISTKPSVGVTVETDEEGKFVLSSDNFTENTSYRIIAKHREYESTEWTGIKPTINSETTLGWKNLKPKVKLYIDFQDTIQLRQTTPLDTDGDVFDN